jgi:hypothetical protein
MKELPEIKDDSVRKIFDDGNHNAFTDMYGYFEWLPARVTLTDNTISKTKNKDN